MSLFDLSGKVAIITGSTRGIGRAIAVDMGRAGAKVVVSSRSAEDTARVAGELTGEGLDAYGVACDIGQKQQVDALVEATLIALGQDRYSGLQRRIFALSRSAWWHVRRGFRRNGAYQLQEQLVVRQRGPPRHGQAEGWCIPHHHQPICICCQRRERPLRRLEIGRLRSRSPACRGMGTSQHPD